MLTEAAVAKFQTWYIPEPMSGCWLWTAVVDRDGYGRYYAERSMFYAHRFAYKLHHGKLTPGATIDHLCRNRACVNPRHLELVTQLVNVRRGATPRIDAAKAKAIFLDPRSQRQTGADYGINHGTVQMIRARRTWRDVTDGLVPPARKRNQWR